jgi:SOS-response transcriptional repressor LexA
METIGSRLRQLRKLKKKTLGEIGSLVERSSAAVSFWEKDINEPDENTIDLLSKYYGVSKTYIRYGNIEGDYSPILVQFGGLRIPVLQPSQLDKYSSDNEDSVTEWLYVDESYSKKSFGFKVLGDSMEGDPSKTIPDGSIVVIEPSFNISDLNGKVVLAVYKETGLPTIKEIQIDGPNKYLVPWNKRYKVIDIDGDHDIIGYVKDIIIRLRS